MRTAAAAAQNTRFVPQHAATISEGKSRLAPTSDTRMRLQRLQQVHLTARQRDVLALLCEGLPNKLICRRLNISSGTVKAHISSILRELGVSSRLQAVVTARESGVLDAEYETSE